MSGLGGSSASQQYVIPGRCCSSGVDSLDGWCRFPGVFRLSWLYPSGSECGVRPGCGENRKIERMNLALLLRDRKNLASGHRWIKEPEAGHDFPLMVGYCWRIALKIRRAEFGQAEAHWQGQTRFRTSWHGVSLSVSTHHCDCGPGSEYVSLRTGPSRVLPTKGVPWSPAPPALASSG